MTTTARPLTRLTTRFTAITAMLSAVAAIGFATPSAHAADKPVRIVQLEPVTIVGKRIRVIELQRVTIVAKRQVPSATLVAQRAARASAPDRG